MMLCGLLPTSLVLMVAAANGCYEIKQFWDARFLSKLIHLEGIIPAWLEFLQGLVIWLFSRVSGADILICRLKYEKYVPKHDRWTHMCPSMTHGNWMGASNTLVGHTPATLRMIGVDFPSSRTWEEGKGVGVMKCSSRLAKNNHTQNQLLTLAVQIPIQCTSHLEPWQLLLLLLLSYNSEDSCADNVKQELKCGAVCVSKRQGGKRLMVVKLSRVSARDCLNAVKCWSRYR